MATSRRRTSKKDIGQNLNELERRARQVERRPSRSYVEKSVIDSTSLGEGSVTIDNLDPALAAIISTNSNTFDTISLASEDLSSTLNLANETSNISFLGADGKTQVYYQSTAPTSDGRVPDDLWYDTDADYKPYRWGFESVSITSVVVSGASSPYTATLTTSAAHTLADGNYITITGLSAGIGLNGTSWEIDTPITGTTFTITGITTATPGTYSSESGTGTSDNGAWLEAPFGDAALASLTVGKLLTGTLRVATIATIGDPLASGGTGTGGSIVINGGTGYTGIKLFKSDGTNTVFLNASTGDASFTGTVTAAAGSIGGWSIGASALTAGSSTSTVGLVSTSTAGTVAIYAGNSTPASAPFRVTNQGALTATNATITGSITASSGSIGGFTIGADTLSSGATTTYVTVSSGTTAFSAGGATPASAPFNVSRTGVVTATSGTIGGWTLGANSLTAGTGSSAVGLVSTATAGTIAIYAGDSTPANAEFRVTNQGALTASSATVTGVINANTGYIGGASGWTIDSGQIYNTLTGTNKSSTVYVTAPSSLTATTNTFRMISYSDVAGDYYSQGIFGLRYDSSLLVTTPYINLLLKSSTPYDGYIANQLVISGTSPNQTAVITVDIPLSINANDTVVLSGFSYAINGTKTVSSKTTFTLTITGLSGLTNGTYTTGLGVVGGYFTQNILMFSATPNSSSYASVLIGLPSISIDGPDGTVAGMIGAYEQKIFGFETVSGQSWINIGDVQQSDRFITITTYGGTSNSNNASLILTGNSGNANLGAATSSNTLYIDIDASTKTIDVTAHNVSGVINAVGSLRRTGMATRRYYNEASGTGTSLTAGTYIAVNYNTENYAATATASAYGTSSSGGVRWYTVPHQGYYRVSGQVYFDGGTGAGRREVRVQLVDASVTPTASSDGVDYCFASAPSAGTEVTVPFDDIVLANEADDKIVVWARMVSDTGVSVNEGSNRTFITIEYVGSTT